MSIREQLSAHVSTGALHALSPAVAHQGGKLQRGVFVAQEVWNLVGDDVSVDARLEKVSGQARAKLDSFSRGRAFIFALHPKRKSALSDIARNAPLETGIVDVRITNPAPTIRIFGGFAARDLLVLLTWQYRENLDFEKEVIRCQSKWNILFPDTAPLIGSTHDEYVSKPVFPG